MPDEKNLLENAKELGQNGAHYPTQRAAFSNRTAWLMAILADAAYIRFEQATEESVFKLAEDLAEISDPKTIEVRLSELKSRWSENRGDASKLEEILGLAGLKLQATIFNDEGDPTNDTEAFLATYDDPDNPDHRFAVIAFRGSTSAVDWLNNVDAKLEDVRAKRPDEKVPPQVHRGIWRSYKNAETDINEQLKCVREYPLYLTGHSLGGALAVLCAYFQPKDNLAACYTFGAPRLGNYEFFQEFYTPIYRVVNSFDPVTLLPPSKEHVAVLKFINQVLSTFLFPSFFLWFRKFATKRQGYLHAADLRYMANATEDKDGEFTFKTFTNFDLGQRIKRLISIITMPDSYRRIDRYHDMGLYRRKLRHLARPRNLKIFKPEKPNEAKTDPIGDLGS